MWSALHGLALWTPLGAPAFLFVITLVVFFHELGHYAVARACGVKVETFSIGFGRELIGWTAKSGTRWKISLVPLGGYVKFLGDANAASTPDRAAVEQIPLSEREGILFFKPLWQRALVVVAGPVANFVLAIVMLTGLLLYSGHTIIAPVIGSVAKGSAAEAAGVKPGDRILQVGGTRITGYDQLTEIVPLSGGKTLALQLERAGHVLTLHVTPRLETLPDGFGEPEQRYIFGVLPQVQSHLKTEYYGPVGAFVAACAMTWDIVHDTLTGVAQMARGQGGASQLHGPLGIADITQKVAVLGFLDLLQLASVLSVSIGLVNLFPIPLLDGGHLLYYGCEAVLGRPLGERAQDVGFRLGLAFVLGLFLLATWDDLIRLNLF